MQTTCHKTDLADNLSISLGHQMSLSSIFSLERDPLHQVLYINNFLLKKKKNTELGMNLLLSVTKTCGLRSFRIVKLTKNS